jgi:predicted DNA-binding antitoxin AbrB/MazE fold protein
LGANWAEAEVTHQVDAVYEDGVLRLLAKLDDLAENARVRVTVEPVDSEGHVADCAGTLPDEAANEMSRIIADDERVDLGE